MNKYNKNNEPLIDQVGLPFLTVLISIICVLIIVVSLIEYLP